MPDEELVPCLDLAVETLAGAEVHLDHYAAAAAHVERSSAIAQATGPGLLVPIAAALFLSRKTVETHIRNVFHSLSSRVDVARAVERADCAAGHPTSR